MDEKKILIAAEGLYSLAGCECTRVPGHEGGRNAVYIVNKPDGGKTVLRISVLPDRTMNDYLAETEFVHYLARNGAPVADVIPSVRQYLVEQIKQDGHAVYLCMFRYAAGILISDNGYRYREGAPIEEYFYNTGKTLGIIHRLSKQYVPLHRRRDYREKYNRENIDRLIPDRYRALKAAICERFDRFDGLPADASVYGMVHFDFSDGNYHIDMKTGKITAFDFDNCMNCWYMFDLANLWTHGEGWCRHIQDRDERLAYWNHYFDTVLAGYRAQTFLADEMLNLLPLFIDMVLIENIVDEFECCIREGRLPEDEDICEAAEYLLQGQ